MGTILISEDNKEYIDKSFSGSLYARMPHPDGRLFHTFRTATVLADGSHITFKNCTFANTSGKGCDVGQAIALYLDGDDITLENCTLLGHQDTLFLAPLPLREREKDGFIGPGKDKPRVNHTFHFKNCYIEGGVDFIFGGATAFFEDCEFKSVEEGYVFAPNTPENVQIGFVARNCRFTADKEIPKGSCYIARPWRKFARVTIESCFLGEHINPLGWDDWGKIDAHETMHFIEINSYGPGANDAARAGFVKVLRG